MNGRETPALIERLLPGEVFVFGSNESGFHAGGAARAAYIFFGAEDGKGFGPAGATFAIPTLNWQMKELRLNVIGHYVRRFIKYARMNKKQTFYVTPIGCGIAGRTPEQIAPLFKGARRTKNIYLPKEFWDVINAL